MFVGEIGIPRREFLYDVTLWEARRIVRGYRRRDRLKHQLIAECVYAAMYAMRDPKGMTVADLFPTLFCDTDSTKETRLSKADIEELEDLIRQENARLKSK